MLVPRDRQGLTFLWSSLLVVPEADITIQVIELMSCRIDMAARVFISSTRHSPVAKFRGSQEVRTHKFPSCLDAEVI